MPQVHLFSVAELAIAAPELFLALAGIFLLMFGVFSPAERAARSVTGAAVAAMVVTAVLVILAPIPEGGHTTAFNAMFRADAFGAFMKVLVLLGSAFALLLSVSFFEKEKVARFEYPVLVVFATLGMMMMVSANDLMSLYMGLELQSLSLYVVASINRDNLKSSEAGLKYFVLGALSSGMLLYGSSLIYGFAGTTNFTLMAAHFAGGEAATGAVFGLVFVIAALAFKVSAVPFHMWTPDVYEGAPTPVTAFFAAAPKVAAMSLLVRVLIGPFEPLAGQWQQIIVFVSIASMVFGAVAAINQQNIKRLMAYSSIGHMGFALVGLASNNESGIIGVMVYLAIYVVMGAGTFACILAMRSQGKAVERIDDLAGLAKTNPALALTLALFMFSMAGIPPLAGFFSKLYVFLAAVEAHQYALAIIGVVASVVGAYYYLRIIKVMYFDAPTGEFDAITPSIRTVAIVTALLNGLFWVQPAWLVGPAIVAARSIIGG